MCTGHAKLLPGEIFWHDRAVWPKEWPQATTAPSTWLGSIMTVTKEPYECEDGTSGMRSYAFMDAKDMSTGQIVAMKFINHQENPEELAIATFFTGEEKSSDCHNHCSLFFEYSPFQTKKRIIVMPYLRPWYDLKFKTVGEGFQFFKEMLEGFQFIHHNHVAHRDGGFTSIMIDATSMYGPDSFHPDQIDLKYDFSSRARYRSRTERPQKHNSIDFGLSILYKSDELPVTVRALEGGDKSVPEFLADDPDRTKRTSKHDPFAVDVYYLGNAF